MKYLLDTNVLSEYRKVEKGTANPNFVKWQQHILLHQLYLSSITVMEINIGILRLARKDKKQAFILKNWFENKVLPNFKQQIFSFDLTTAIICSELHIPDPRPERDTMIASTALQHNLVLVTRNVKDFNIPNLSIINPFE